MKLSSLQQFGFAVAVFALGCASSLWLESSGNTNRFYQDGALIAAPVSLPQDSQAQPSPEVAESERIKDELAKKAY